MPSLPNLLRAQLYRLAHTRLFYVYLLACAVLVVLFARSAAAPSSPASAPPLSETLSTLTAFHGFYAAFFSAFLTHFTLDDLLSGAIKNLHQSPRARLGHPAALFCLVPIASFVWCLALALCELLTFLLHGGVPFPTTSAQLALLAVRGYLVTCVTGFLGVAMGVLPLTPGLSVLAALLASGLFMNYALPPEPLALTSTFALAALAASIAAASLAAALFLRRDLACST